MGTVNVYRIQIRKRASRTKSGTFATRHTSPKVVAVEETPNEGVELGAHIAAQVKAAGASKFDRILVDYVGEAV